MFKTEGGTKHEEKNKTDFKYRIMYAICTYGYNARDGK